ncbi:MAG: MFS transporter [Planktotalea sp.]|uniref:MFS transporter n=1 Tax=Planktotalea sp. TaxID=2029877 RepID=UPI003C75DFA4
MNIGLILLSLAYVLSQFYRAFLAVLTDVLGTDLGATPDMLATASGLWFLSFAVMQIPVGWALDALGPRRTSATLLLIGGAGGAAVFALAGSPMHINIAMLLIGVGCSPVLMASFYVFARMYPAAMFATLGAIMIGVGSLGNLAGSVPLTWAVEVFGWRETLWALSGVTVVIAIGLWFVITDPPALESDEKGTLFDLFKIRALWFILPLMLVYYAPAGAMRGLWIGPYVTDMFGGNAGIASLWMGCAMIAGTFAYGPLDRMLGTRKWVALAGNALACLSCLLLGLGVAQGYWSAVALFAAAGFFGMSFPLLMAHGRAFIPAHLVGRGVTLMNLFGIGGVGLWQVISGRMHAALSPTAVNVSDSYHAIFLFFAAMLAIGVFIYSFSEDRID